MSYDQQHTTVLPQMGFPITEEIPVVRGGRGSGGRGPGGNGFLKIAAVLLIAAMIAIAAVLVIDNQRSNQVATSDQDSTEPTAEADATPAPTAVTLDDVEPAFWQVIGVTDGLNVRSGPGTNNDIVGSLGAAERHVFGTGERAEVNGAEWTQITFGNNDTSGWVSSRFLANDTAPDPNAPTPPPVVSGSVSVVCFESERTPQRIAQLQFVNRTGISGIVRTIQDQTVTDQSVTGTLVDGSAQMTLTNTATDASSSRIWTFNPANIDIGNGTKLSVVACATVEGRLP